MALNLGIIGLPKSGKTTLFNAITGSHAQTSAYASGEQPNVAVVKVPDPRLDVLAKMYNPRKNTPADVQFTDVGVSPSQKERDAKEPISRQTLGFISTVDALVLVVRAFANPSVPLPEGTEGIDPIRDVENLMLEMAFSDLGIIERRLERVKGEIAKLKGPEREVREHEQEVLTRLQPALEEGTPIRDLGLNEDDEKAIRNYGFLTAKPVLIVANLGENNLDQAEEIEARMRAKWSGDSTNVIAIPAQLEMEMGQLAPGGRRRVPREHGSRPVEAERSSRAGIFAPGPAQLPDCGGGRGARLDYPPGHSRPARRRRHPLRPGARLHPRRGGPLRRPDSRRKHGRGQEARHGEDGRQDVCGEGWGYCERPLYSNEEQHTIVDAAALTPASNFASHLAS